MSEALPITTPENQPPADFPSELVDIMIAGSRQDKPGDTKKELKAKDKQREEWDKQFAEAGGPEILKGLQLEVPNVAPGRYDLDTPGNLPSSSRYEIRDVKIKQSKQQHYRRTGVPFIHNSGGIFYAGKGSRLHDVLVKTPLYTIDKYNDADELVEVEVYTQEKLANLARLANKWSMKSPDEQETDELETDQGNSREVRVDTGFGQAEPFDRISQQLEDRNVFNWGGLTFKRTWQKSDETVTRTVEIVRDTLLADYHENWSKNGRGSRTEATSTRTFVVEERDEEGFLVSKEVIKGNNIKKYFKGPQTSNKKDKNRHERFSDMHIAVPELTDAQHTDEVTARRLENAMAHDEIGTLAYMLGYGDIINSTDKDTAQEIEEAMHEITESAEGAILSNALKELIARHGMENILAIANEIKDQFLASAAELHLPTDFSDPLETKNMYGKSTSWVLEKLAAHHYFSRQPGSTDSSYPGLIIGDPLGSNDRAKRIQRNIVDEQLGWALISQTIHKKKPKPVGVDKGQIMYKEEEGVEFLEEPLTKLPELTREEAKALEEIIYHAVDEKAQPDINDLASLGRVLERSVGRRDNN